MTDIEISKALALAIGWTENRLDEHRCLDPDIALFGGYGFKDEVKVWFDEKWRTFDYRDPTVIWPIAKAFNCFPSLIVLGKNRGKWMAFSNEHSVTANTPEKAVAMVLIGYQP